MAGPHTYIYIWQDGPIESAELEECPRATHGLRVTLRVVCGSKPFWRLLGLRSGLGFGFGFGFRFGFGFGFGLGLGLGARREHLLMLSWRRCAGGDPGV